MKVLKFGGSSVGSAEGLANIRTIVENRTSPVVVVVSALGGITDALIEISALAAEDSPKYPEKLAQIRHRHYQAVEQSVPKEFHHEILVNINAILAELETILKGVSMIRDLSPKTSAAIVAFGERLGSNIVSQVLANSRLIDACRIIKTKPYFSRHIIDFQLTNNLIRAEFSEIPEISVMGGFISSDRDTGETTNLGRGGSDYTAALIASALGAEQLDIYTDVDGFMTADPRIVSKAYLIEHLSYVEAMELCNFGAKVIYAPTIFPAYNRNVPVAIKNTYNIDCDGTYISSSPKNCDQKLIKGISSIKDISLIAINSSGTIGAVGLNYRISKSLAKVGISILMVAHHGGENSLAIGVRSSDENQTVKTLQEEFSQELTLGEIGEITVQRSLSMVAIVGQQIKMLSGLAGKLFGELGRKGVNIVAYSQAASETNISFAVETGDLTKTLNVIHDSFLMSDLRQINLFVEGYDAVSRSFLALLDAKKQTLEEQNNLKINVVGIRDNDNSIIAPEGINISEIDSQIKTLGEKVSDSTLSEQLIAMGKFNTVYVDSVNDDCNTDLYETFLANNISVVSANKSAVSSNYDDYKNLKNRAVGRGSCYFYDAVVGSGLPVIRTISDLMSSGDHVRIIRATVSGTLNLVLNSIDEKTSFSKALKIACEVGYAESDPRVDISGADAIRKLVVMAREAGYAVEREEVALTPIFPKQVFEGAVSDFWSELEKCDGLMESLRSNAADRGHKLAFVATMDSGQCSLAIEEVDSSDPLYHSKGSNCIFLIHSSRYREYPLQLKSYEYNPNAVAKGMLDDLMRIANLR